MIQKPEYPIKMIAIDLDDTLIRDDTTVSDYTKDTIRRAQQKGIHIMIATGRMYATASPYGRMLGLGDIPMMLFGGGLIQTLESKKNTLQPSYSDRKMRHSCSRWRKKKDG
jgi:hydroxymethylpyrimidine pyrophosphatase-like HAD family hydrolase